MRPQHSAASVLFTSPLSFEYTSRPPSPLQQLCKEEEPEMDQHTGPLSSGLKESDKYRQSFGYSSSRTFKSILPTPTEAHNFTISLHGKKESATHKLIQESRKLIIPTYLLLQIAVLFAFTVLHWGRRIQSWRGRRGVGKKRVRLDSNGELDNKPGPEEETEVIFNNNHYGDYCDGLLAARGLSPPSSASVAKGINPRRPMRETTPNLEPEEQTPLLFGNEIDSSIRIIPPTSWLLIIRRQLKAWLVYQPNPIPFFNKTLPSNGTSVTILFLIGIQIFYTFYNVHLSIPNIIVFADRTSLLFVANLPLLYLLAAKNQPIKLLTGYSYEALNIFHRRLGEIMVLLGLIHAIGMFVDWYIVLRPTGFSLMEYLSHKIILWGIGASVSYNLLYITSLGSFRQRFYELFLGLHIMLHTIALLFLWFHHSNSRPYVYASLAIFLVDRFVYRMGLKNRITKGILEVKDDQNTVVLRARLSKPAERQHKRWNHLLSHDIRAGWKATEHVFLTVPCLSPKHGLQAHPFTIASKAPGVGDTELDLELIIRKQEGFCKDLLEYAKENNDICHLPLIKLDGPYGSQSAVNLVQECNLSIIVAGGSGIAVTWPLVWSAIDTTTQYESGKRNADPEDVLYPYYIPRKILFIWIVRDSSNLSWLGSDKLERLGSVQGVKVVIPPPTAHNGHPDLGSIIKSWISTTIIAKSFLAHDDDVRSNGNNAAGKKIGIVCSGPDGLNRTVRNLCSLLLSQGKLDVSVEIEKFGW